MPLIKSGSKQAISANIKAEKAAGKPQKQAVAIALSVARRARRQDGGAVRGNEEPARFSKSIPIGKNTDLNLSASAAMPTVSPKDWKDVIRQPETGVRLGITKRFAEGGEVDKSPSDVWERPTPFSAVGLAKSIYEGLRGAGRAATGAYSVQPETPGQWSEADEFRARHARQQMREDAGQLGGALMTGSIPSMVRARANPNQLNVFAGPMADTARRSEMEHAKRMVASGKTYEEAFDETGWFKGADQDWRFPISDRKAVWTPDAQRLQHQPNVRLGDALAHPELYKAYRNLANTPYRFGGKGIEEGGYNTRDKDIVMFGPSSKTVRSGTLHEIQHAIQGIENFGVGSGHARVDKQPGLAKLLLTEGMPALGLYVENMNTIRKAAAGTKENFERLSGRRLDDHQWRRFVEEAKNPPKSLRLMAIQEALDSAYIRSSGEVEARAVQAMDENPLQHRYPWYYWDTPRDKQIVMRIGDLHHIDDAIRAKREAQKFQEGGAVEEDDGIPAPLWLESGMIQEPDGGFPSPMPPKQSAAWRDARMGRMGPAEPMEFEDAATLATMPVGGPIASGTMRALRAAARIPSLRGATAAGTAGAASLPFLSGEANPAEGPDPEPMRAPETAAEVRGLQDKVTQIKASIAGLQTRFSSDPERLAKNLRGPMAELTRLQGRIDLIDSDYLRRHAAWTTRNEELLRRRTAFEESQREQREKASVPFRTREPEWTDTIRKTALGAAGILGGAAGVYGKTALGAAGKAMAAGAPIGAFGAYLPDLIDMQGEPTRAGAVERMRDPMHHVGTALGGVGMDVGTAGTAAYVGHYLPKVARSIGSFPTSTARSIRGGLDTLRRAPQPGATVVGPRGRPVHRTEDGQWRYGNNRPVKEEDLDVMRATQPDLFRASGGRIPPGFAPPADPLPWEGGGFAPRDVPVRRARPAPIPFPRPRPMIEEAMISRLPEPPPERLPEPPQEMVEYAPSAMEEPLTSSGGGFEFPPFLPVLGGVARSAPSPVSRIIGAVGPWAGRAARGASRSDPPPSVPATVEEIVRPMSRVEVTGMRPMRGIPRDSAGRFRRRDPYSEFDGMQRGGAVDGYAGGGSIPIPWTQRSAAQRLSFAGGLLNSPVPGRTDNLSLNVPSGAYVVPSSVVSFLGQDNTMAGAGILDAMFSSGPAGMRLGRGSRGRSRGMGMGRRGKRKFEDGGSVGEATPINAAGGEYVISPEQLIEKFGDLDIAHKIMDKFVEDTRKEHIATLEKLPGPAK